MKKLIAMILCVLLIASMSVTAFATNVPDEDIESNTNSKKTGDVKVQVYDETTGDVVTSTGTYKVTVKWGNLTFMIKVADAKTDVKWEDDAYTITNGKWDHTTTDVTVTNESDMAIKVNGVFDNDSTTSETVDGVTATISGGEQDLASAAGLPAAPVATYEVKITPETAPATISKLEFVVDTIKLTIQTAA